jgi:arsenite methyltransferase
MQQYRRLTAMTKPNYGIDAPSLVRGFLIGALVLLAFGIALFNFGSSLGTWPRIAGVVTLSLSLYPFGMFCLMNYESRIAKIADCKKILNLVNWSGNERVLDVGCGRGLMMIGAAKCLTRGKAVGIDLWLERDQSSNSANAPLENAKLEGVTDRVSVETADMRKLPFPDKSFDIVLSSWALHNLENKADRAMALMEMLRVLRPTGSLLLTDIVNRKEYLAELEKMNTSEARLIIFSSLKDRIVRAASFGSYGPSTILAKKF